jgi:hypothetical protein
MKKLLFIIVISVLYAACTGTTTASNESTEPKAMLSFPYTAAYSSKFSIGSDSSALTVLNNYKAWEAGDMDALKNTMGDSITLSFSNGYKFIGTRDSAMYYASQFRDSLSKVEIRIDAWVPLHAEDKNANWVGVWYTETDTYKNGKIDSAYYQDDNMLDENGKIIFSASHKQVLR